MKSSDDDDDDEEEEEEEEEDFTHLPCDVTDFEMETGRSVFDVTNSRIEQEVVTNCRRMQCHRQRHLVIVVIVAFSRDIRNNNIQPRMSPDRTIQERPNFKIGFSFQSVSSSLRW